MPFLAAHEASGRALRQRAAGGRVALLAAIEAARLGRRLNVGQTARLGHKSTRAHHVGLDPGGAQLLTEAVGGDKVLGALCTNPHVELRLGLRVVQRRRLLSRLPTLGFNAHVAAHLGGKALCLEEMLLLGREDKVA